MVWSCFKQETELEVKDVSPNIHCMQAAKKAENFIFLSLVTLTFDLQTRPSVGPNTSSV